MLRKEVDTKTKQLGDIFDQVVAKFEENLYIIFSSESERKRILFKNVREKDKTWCSSKDCIVHGCGKPSIIRSHTIQKAGSLEIIAEQGHVLTPAVGRSNGRLGMILVGINEASTFPGFCHKHEMIFKDFENRKNLSHAIDFALQIYRTVCREVVVKRHAIEYNSMILKHYLDFRNTKFFELMMSEAKKRGLDLDKVKLVDLNFRGLDYRETVIKANIKKMKKHLREFEKEFYNPYVKIMQNKNTRYMFAWEAIELDFMIPVCLAGVGNFGFRGKNGQRNIHAVLQVLPFNDKTFVMIVVPIKYEKYLGWYANKFLSSDLDIVGAIESWMIHGSDHWFIKPSIWNKINTHTQQKILEDIWDTKKNIGDIYGHSIFSDLKNALAQRNRI